ncbi:MAG TPA: helix-turn-helix domain-containing protein [Anaerolineales bacterium]|nr:helix-turn-helix domain-containing protein [Anaerolineales bacterium]
MPENKILSDRELEILKLVATGASNKQIAAELHISVNTVKVHLRNIYSKLDVSSRTEATIYAVRLGLVPSPRPEPELNEIPPTTDDTTPKDTSQKSAWERWGKWLAIAGIVFVLILVAGALSTQWVKRQSATAVPAAIDAQAFERDRWQERSPMLMQRAGFAAIVFNNQIYALGGETASGLTAAAERYDVLLDEWTFIPEMLEPLTDIQGATVGGKIYVPGGRRADGSISDRLLVYDPHADAWETRAPMPVALSAYALTAFEGKLYLFGGWDGEQYTNRALRYDPSLDVWNEIPPMPTARGYAGAAVSGGMIHVMGGDDGSQMLTAHDVYAPDKGVWDTFSPLPAVRSRFACASVAGIIHLLGGLDDAQSKDVLAYRYLPADDIWGGFAMPSGVWSDLGAVTVGENIHLFGGRLGAEYTGQNYTYRAIYSIMLPVSP